MARLRVTNGCDSRKVRIEKKEGVWMWKKEKAFGSSVMAETHSQQLKDHAEFVLQLWLRNMRRKRGQILQVL